jgi:hypothetical protein
MLQAASRVDRVARSAAEAFLAALGIYLRPMLTRRADLCFVDQHEPAVEGISTFAIANAGDR